MKPEIGMIVVNLIDIRRYINIADYPQKITEPEESYGNGKFLNSEHLWRIARVDGWSVLIERSSGEILSIPLRDGLSDKRINEKGYFTEYSYAQGDHEQNLSWFVSYEIALALLQHDAAKHIARINRAVSILQEMSETVYPNLPASVVWEGSAETGEDNPVAAQYPPGTELLYAVLTNYPGDRIYSDRILPYTEPYKWTQDNVDEAFRKNSVTVVGYPSKPHESRMLLVEKQNGTRAWLSRYEMESRTSSYFTRDGIYKIIRENREKKEQQLETELLSLQREIISLHES